MAKATPDRYLPKNMPDDWRDDSLHRAAVTLNKSRLVPAVFTDDSLSYLEHLGYALPRKGVLFIASADEFIRQVLIESLRTATCSELIELLSLQIQKETAIRDHDFETAAKIREQQCQLESLLASCTVHEITRPHIDAALRKVGVDPERGWMDNE
jgi:hypothetical protein